METGGDFESHIAERDTTYDKDKLNETVDNGGGVMKLE